jgi:hypothetical protein
MKNQKKIRSDNRLIDFIVYQYTGCHLCTSQAGTGRFRDRPSKRINGKLTKVSHIIWEECFGFIPDGFHVLHHCDIPQCINPEHLFLGTNTDNIRDKIKKGRLRCLHGEKCSWSKLTENQVRKIRTMPGKQRDIAKKFGVAQIQISAIRTGKTWKHVK